MPHCLVVDDSEVIRKIVSILLTDIGYEVSEAESGEPALAQCIARMPDVILVDWHMPGMAGLEFASSLRLQAGGEKPFVVYCTTENDPVDIARALAAGADDYLLKPFDRDTLRAKFADVSAAA